MRHIRTFGTFLFEGKSMATIYHFTMFDSLESILDEDRMESSAMFDYISFTRNPIFTFHNLGGRRTVRISFDGDAMSDKFSFQPFMYDPDKDPMYYDPEHMDYRERRELYGEEREERIKKKEIHGIKKYITLIELIRNPKDQDFEKRMTIMEKENPEIAFRIVGSFTLPSQEHFGKMAA